MEGVCLYPALYETFSFLSDLQGFKHFITVLSVRNALGDRVECYVHIHFDIHKPAQSNSGSTLYMHFLVGLLFSPRKNTLEKTVV